MQRRNNQSKTCLARTKGQPEAQTNILQSREPCRVSRTAFAGPCLMNTSCRALSFRFRYLTPRALVALVGRMNGFFCETEEHAPKALSVSRTNILSASDFFKKRPTYVLMRSISARASTIMRMEQKARRSILQHYAETHLHAFTIGGNQEFLCQRSNTMRSTIPRYLGR